MKYIVVNFFEYDQIGNCHAQTGYYQITDYENMLNIIRDHMRDNNTQIEQYALNSYAHKEWESQMKTQLEAQKYAGKELNLKLQKSKFGADGWKYRFGKKD